MLDQQLLALEDEVCLDESWHTLTSDVTSMSEACHSYECVILNEACHFYEYVMLYIWGPDVSSKAPCPRRRGHACG